MGFPLQCQLRYQMLKLIACIWCLHYSKYSPQVFGKPLHSQSIKITISVLARVIYHSWVPTASVWKRDKYEQLNSAWFWKDTGHPEKWELPKPASNCVTAPSYSPGDVQVSQQPSHPTGLTYCSKKILLCVQILQRVSQSGPDAKPGHTDRSRREMYLPEEAVFNLVS